VRIYNSTRGFFCQRYWKGEGVERKKIEKKKDWFTSSIGFTQTFTLGIKEEVQSTLAGRLYKLSGFTCPLTEQVTARRPVTIPSPRIAQSKQLSFPAQQFQLCPILPKRSSRQSYKTGLIMS